MLSQEYYCGIFKNTTVVEFSSVRCGFGESGFEVINTDGH